MSTEPWIDQDGFDGPTVISNPTGAFAKLAEPTSWFAIRIRGDSGSLGHGLQERVGGDLPVDDPATLAPDGVGDFPAAWTAAVHGSVPGSDPFVTRSFVAIGDWSMFTQITAGVYAHPSRTTKWWADGSLAALKLLTWRFQFFIDQDPDLISWPTGAIGVEYEGPSILSDVAVSMAGTQGEIDHQSTVLAGFGDPADYYIGDLGPVRLVPGESTNADSYIDDALATYPDVTELTDVFGGPVETDPDAFIVPTSFATAIPDQYTPTAPSIPGALGDRYGYFFLFGKIALTVTATVVRPRYRWIFEGGLFPLRRYPPINNGGSGPTRHYPRSPGRRGTY